MATVYLARDVKHHRQVAINVLKPELATSIGAERFLREIRVAATLQHPNILGLYDSGEADGLLYYVMPFIEGESLRDRLDEAMAVARRAIAWHERGARNDSLRVDSAMESTVDGQRTNDARPPRLLTLDPRPSTLDPRPSTLDSRLSTLNSHAISAPRLRGP